MDIKYIFMKLIKCYNGVLHMILNLIKCGQIIFIGLSEHFTKYPIEQEIKKVYPSADILLIDQVTDGQATTCNLVIKDVPDDTSIMISACDNGVYYDTEKYDLLYMDTTVDVIIYSFLNHSFY